MKLLVVEDADPLRRRLVLAAAEIEGIEVIAQVGNAPAALSAFRSLRPDVVTLDLRLARNSGVEVLDAIKLEAPATVVIVFTQYATAPYRQRCLEAGADYFFSKKDGFQRLVKILQHLRRGEAEPRALREPVAIPRSSFLQAARPRIIDLHPAAAATSPKNGAQENEHGNP